MPAGTPTSRPSGSPTSTAQPIAEPAGLFPGEPGVVEGALPFHYGAEREGGPRNGVLTAIEDFIEGREGLRLATMPVFFGFGVLWHTDAPWASAVAEIVEPWDRNPLLERLEANRVYHLASVHREQRAKRAMVRASASRARRSCSRRCCTRAGWPMADRLAALRHPGTADLMAGAGQGRAGRERPGLTLDRSTNDRRLP